MTDEAALKAAIWGDPENDLYRLVYADYLDEHDGAMPCEAVGPHHHGDRCNGGRVQSPNAQFTLECQTCRGTGSVSNGFAARAELIRVGCGLAALESQAADLLDDEVDWSACTGIAAAWCPNCGDCSCRDREESMNDPGCPLHAPSSPHCCLENLNDKITRYRDRESALLAANAERWVVPILHAIWPGTSHTQAGTDFTSVTGGRVNGTIRFARGFLDRVNLTLADLTDTVAAVLGAAGPLGGGVELRDRNPWERAGYSPRSGWWGDGVHDDDRSILSIPLMDLLANDPRCCDRASGACYYYGRRSLRGCVLFDSPGVAVAALDAAAASFCRLAAGYPALPHSERIGAR